MNANINGLSVLVIDDDDGTRNLLLALLKRANADVECVPDGRLGLERLRSRFFSVVILDLLMPAVDGFEVLKHLSASMPELLNRVIVLTALSNTTLQALNQKDVWQVIRKPCDINELVRSVTECARHHDSQHEQGSLQETL